MPLFIPYIIVIIKMIVRHKLKNNPPQNILISVGSTYRRSKNAPQQHSAAIIEPVTPGSPRIDQYKEQMIPNVIIEYVTTSVEIHRSLIVVAPGSSIFFRLRSMSSPPLANTIQEINAGIDKPLNILKKPTISLLSIFGKSRPSASME